MSNSGSYNNSSTVASSSMAPSYGKNNTSMASKIASTAGVSSQVSSNNNETAGKTPLYASYPLNVVMELTLLPTREVVRGVVHTTDEISNTIILKKTLQQQSGGAPEFEIRIINASSVLDKKTIQDLNKKQDGTDLSRDLSQMSLPSVNKKSLEEKERRAIRLAEESFTHINQKASTVGQAVFDRLVKACNEVVWRGESILVLNQIRVDPPYGKEDCKLLTNVGAVGGGTLNEGSLERVKMIVAAAIVKANNPG